jgi:hypothetical protein
MKILHEDIGFCALFHTFVAPFQPSFLHALALTLTVRVATAKRKDLLPGTIHREGLFLLSSAG